MSEELVRARIEESVAVKQALLDGEHVALTQRMADVVAESLRGGGKVLFCGNGGSAADSMHLAAELVGRFKLERDALPAISLSDNQSGVTCIGNDYDFGRVFARAVEAFGREGDVLVAISTSGTSPNVIAAAETARSRGMKVVGMTGSRGDRLASLSDVCLRVPSEDTARIQEGYMLIGHTVCELVEAELFAS
jgi:D-sedoheptulose 7-phosphate isomerase